MILDQQCNRVYYKHATIIRFYKIAIILDFWKCNMEIKVGRDCAANGGDEAGLFSCVYLTL